MRISDWSSDVCSSDLETVGVGIVEDAFAFAEQILDQVAVAQFGVRHLFHHHGMGGVIGLGKHGIASSLEIIWLAALLVLMVTGVKGVGTLAGVDFTRTSAHQRCTSPAWPEAQTGKERIRQEERSVGKECVR